MRRCIVPTCLLPRQPGKRAIDLIIDFLSCLWDYAKQQITREIGAVADLVHDVSDSRRVVLAVCLMC